MNAGTTESYCEEYSEDYLVEGCSGECVDGNCIVPDNICIIKKKKAYSDGGGGFVVDCPDGYEIMSGGWSGYRGRKNIEKAKPTGEGWYCDYHDDRDSLCYALCCDENYIHTGISRKNGKLSDGIFAECSEGYTIVGGGFRDKSRDRQKNSKGDQDDSKPVDNGWFCSDDESYRTDSFCFGICAKTTNGFGLDCISVSEELSVSGSWGYAYVECPEGYFLTGGGFTDNSKSNDDPDFNYPKENGWYCKEDFDDAKGSGICYARCCRF